MRKIKTNLSLPKKALPKKRLRGDGKTLVKDERAVSPVIGVILMIAITVVIAAVVASFAYGIIGGVAKAPSAALVIDGARGGNANVTLIHHGGDTITDAFKGGKPPWDSLQVRINGTIYNGTATLNGGTVSGNFNPGDELKLSLGWELSSDDTITVVYTPSGDILQRAKVA